MTRLGKPTFLLALLLLAAYGRPTMGQEAPAARSDRIASYEIDVELKPENRTVEGEEWVSFRNASGRTLNSLWFHLYANAFRNSDTLYMRESESGQDLRAREETIQRGTWGYIQVESVRLEDGTDLSAATRIQETLMEVPLPDPLPPGETIRIGIRFRTRLPRTIARMGYRGDHYDVMQWFPKVAVLVDGKWNAHEFHADSEFFADFGTYDVSLTLPARYVVEATGIRTEDDIDRSSGLRHLRYRAEDVHDFAWIADPNFLRATETYRGVEIVYLHQPYHKNKVERVMAAVRACLDFYGDNLMEYPYPRIVIDDLPMGLGGGMEYPMLFTISVHWGQPRFDRYPENVTIHEFGHQYWYGIMASNEFEEPWLDEGINTYVSSLVEEIYWGGVEPGPIQPTLFRYAASHILAHGLDFEFGPVRFGLTDLLGVRASPFRLGGGNLVGFRWSAGDLHLPGFTDPTLQDARRRYGAVAGTDPIAQPSWEFLTGSYASLVYDKTYLFMKTLEGMLGRETVLAGIRDYVRENRFRHPTGTDLLRALEHASGADLSEIFDQLLYGTQTVDFSIFSARSEPVKNPAGYPLQDRVGDAVAEPVRTDPDPVDPESFRTEVIVYRGGEAVLPVEVELRFEDGSVIRENWDGREHWKRLVHVGPSRLTSAMVDPEFRQVLDLDRNNNSWTAKRNWKGVAKLSTIVLFWFQNLLHLMTALS
ncbi:MAG: M1 family metallopeptidase [Acidobacteria bacterium]|nr:M1 family metallopeptidase [Acidobacteriota bacterium]